MTFNVEAYSFYRRGYYNRYPQYNSGLYDGYGVPYGNVGDYNEGYSGNHISQYYNGASSFVAN